MKRPRLPVLLALSAVGAGIVIIGAVAFEARDPREGFVRLSLTELRLDGRSFRFAGLDIPDATGAPCWRPSDLNKSLDEIGPGPDVARVFSFQRTATTNGVRDWTYLDRMLSVFRAHGERVILVLTDQWKGQPCADSVTDRTLAWYQGGYRTTIEGATSYRDWVSQVVARYRADPTIAFWQLVNEGEARNPDGSCSEVIARGALLAFAEDVGGLVKSLDSNHLLSLGTISGECGSDDADYGYVYASPQIDICDYHDYGFNASAMSNTDVRNGLQVSLDRCHTAGNAFFVGEVGVDVTSLDPPSVAQRATIFRSKLSAQFAAGSVGELLWRWSAVHHPDQGLEVAPGDPSLKLLTEY
jgi:mannan endo-1,4-beta-mannosidase